MGTKAKCTKCGSEKWINTAKLHQIKEQLGVRPRDWLASKYICKECKDRISLIGKSQIDAITIRLESFSKHCMTVAQGFYSNSKEHRNTCKNTILDVVRSNGIQKCRFIFYKKTIIGMVITIPIIGEYKIDFI